MKKNQDFKNASLQALKGNWAPAVGMAVIYVLATTLFLGPYEASVMINPAFYAYTSYTGLFYFAGMMLVVMPLSVGYACAMRDLLTVGNNDIIGNTLSLAFKGYGRNVLAMLLYIVYVFLWTLLLIIPGIIMAYAYALVPYIIKDNPELSVPQAIRKSRQMMKGHKFDLFYLHLSFIGWYLLSLITLGIGLFWLMPYVSGATAAFYESVKAGERIAD